MEISWSEFAQVAVAHLLAVASPGPDFALVLRQSLGGSRREALWTSWGIGTGILWHVAASLLGLGLLLRGSPELFNAVKLAGAGYLAWIGWQALRSRPRQEDGGGGREREVPGAVRGAFVTGLLTNVLNPKATLFFVSLYAMLVDPRTSTAVQAGYGLWMAAATGLWFSLVSVLFTRAEVRGRFLRCGHWIDRAMGAVLLAFALHLATSALP